MSETRRTCCPTKDYEPHRVWCDNYPATTQKAVLSMQPTNIHPTTRRFLEILGELGVLHRTKSQDYGADSDPLANIRGSQDFGIPAWVGCMVRANDKMKRLQTMAKKGVLVNESAEDSFKDLAVYAIIGLVLYEEAKRASAILEQEHEDD